MDEQPALTLVDQIARRLSERILIGEIPPGDRVRQDAVAFEFGVSQAPVREAFARLERRGLVEALPRRGVRVTMLDPRGEREIISMRATLEPLALRSIAARPTSKQIAAAERALHDGDKASDIYESEAANRAFHLAITMPCAMPRLIEAITDLNFSYSRHVFASDRITLWRAHTNMDHGRIFDTFAQGQFDAAADALNRHIRTVDRVSPRRSGHG